MKGFESVRIHSDYAGIKIGMENDISFNFIGKSSYGGFRYRRRQCDLFEKRSQINHKIL